MPGVLQARLWKSRSQTDLLQFSVAIVPMATSAPLLGKAAHSKASIFYGADEYLEELKKNTSTTMKLLR